MRFFRIAGSVSHGKNMDVLSVQTLRFGSGKATWPEALPEGHSTNTIKPRNKTQQLAPSTVPSRQRNVSWPFPASTIISFVFFLFILYFHPLVETIGTHDVQRQLHYLSLSLFFICTLFLSLPLPPPRFIFLSLFLIHSLSLCPVHNPAFILSLFYPLALSRSPSFSSFLLFRCSFSFISLLSLSTIPLLFLIHPLPLSLLPSLAPSHLQTLSLYFNL